MNITMKQFLELLEDIATQPTTTDCDSNCCGTEEDASISDDDVSPADAIDQIISGTLNLYLETKTFPTAEQAHVLSELRKLQISYYHELCE